MGRIRDRAAQDFGPDTERYRNLERSCTAELQEGLERKLKAELKLKLGNTICSFEQLHANKSATEFCSKLWSEHDTGSMTFSDLHKMTDALFKEVNKHLPFVPATRSSSLIEFLHRRALSTGMITWSSVRTNWKHVTVYLDVH